MALDFTIIIPTLNEQNVIEKTILQIKEQKTPASYEIVVVDGGSTDRTVEIAQKHVRVLKSPRADKAYQLNYASAQTDSKYLIFLDADTIIPPNYLEQIRKVFEQDSEIWVCGGHISYVGAPHGFFYYFILVQALIAFVMYAFFHALQFLFQRLRKTPYKIIENHYFFSIGLFIYYSMKQFLGYPEFSGSNICARRDIFEEIGGFQKPAKMGVDWLFSHLVRTYIRKKRHGKMQMIHSLLVKTDARHLNFHRSVARFKTYRDFVEEKK